MRRAVAFGLCAAAALAAAPAPAARAWCRMTTSTATPGPGECITDGIPLAWRHRCSSYRFYNFERDLGPDAVRAIADASFAQWETITCPDGAMPNLEAHEGPEMSLCDRSEYVTGAGNVGTIVFVETMDDWNARMNDAAAYAVTTVWHSRSTGDIYDVDMEINEAKGPYTNCPDTGCPDATHVDLRDVMTHEAGHWFGLAHSAEPMATMYFAAPPGETIKRTLDPDDVAGFCDAYGHAALGASCDDTPRGGLALECGCAVGMDTCTKKNGCCSVAPGAATGAPAAAAAMVLALAGAAVRCRRRRARA